MNAFRRVLVLFLSFALVVFAEGNTFDRVRYNGGSVDSKVDPHEWHNTLIVTSDVITLALKDGTRVEIPPKSVTSISYGQEAHMRALLLHSIGGQPLLLKSLKSDDVDHSEKVEVQAVLTSTGRQNALLEQIVSRLSLEAGVTGVSWEIIAEHE